MPVSSQPCVFLAGGRAPSGGHRALLPTALALARRTEFPIAIEAPGWTLERIAEHDPSWLTDARDLIETGRVEFVGSGYAQCAAPLLPAHVNRWNLRLGLDVYQRLLGTRPRVALIAEQAYSPGLVGIYREAGFEAIVADWDNAFRSHPEWGPLSAGTPKSPEERMPSCQWSGASRSPSRSSSATRTAK